MALAVHIKHAGKVHDVELNPDRPPSAFKENIYQVTGVPPERMKVMIKGGVLKDDTDWKKVAPKAGQTFMVIGAAGELPKPPSQPTVFLEDLDDSELAEALAKPVGLKNLGNTCYMNATIQAMRAIPELQVALNASPDLSPLPNALRNLYSSMSRTMDSVIPLAFLQVLRQVNPQFAEIDRGKGGHGVGYAQQDAEECYGQIVNSLREVPGLPGPSNPFQLESTAPDTRKFVEQYMMGEMRRELRCDEAPDEPMTVSTENVLKIDCNILQSTNYILTGIMNSLDQKIDKNSPSLGRDAKYSQRSRLTRLPAYLTVHMVRFAWRDDILKKAKIMRKVKFPLELDALDLVTDDLRSKMLPVSRRLREIEKERAERRVVRKRMKGVAAGATSKDSSGDVQMVDLDTTAGPSAGESSVTTTATPGGTGAAAVGDGDGSGDGVGKGKGVVAGELLEEREYREREVAELDSLVDPSAKGDTGRSVSGLYELVAIVTHKGAAADAGHYIGFVKKSVFQATASSAASPSTSSTPLATTAEDDEDWYKFDDERVSVFPVEKLATLDGGGEDSSAYVLLYKTKSIS